MITYTIECAECGARSAVTLADDETARLEHICHRLPSWRWVS